MFCPLGLFFFFCLGACYFKGRSLRCSQGRGNAGGCAVMLYVGEGPRGSNGARFTLLRISLLHSATHKVQYIFKCTSNLIVDSSLFLSHCPCRPFVFYLHCKFGSLPLFTLVVSQLLAIILLFTTQKHFPSFSYLILHLSYYLQSLFTFTNLSSTAVEIVEVAGGFFLLV